MKDNPYHLRLAYSGAIPFVGCAALAWLGISSVPVFGDVGKIAATYGAVIASFMAGIHWGTYLYFPERSPINLLVSSNVATLGVWLALLSGPVAGSLIANAVAFACLLYVDTQLTKHGMLSARYIAMRRVVSGVVIFSLLITAAAL